MSGNTHRAIAATSLGVIDEIQVPTIPPGSGQILVKVAFSGLGPAESQIVHHNNFLGSEWPVTLGFALAGSVVTVGADITDLHVGDKVTALAIGPRARGTQEYALLPRKDVAKVPVEYPLELAATIPDNFVTAYWVVFGALKFPVPVSLPASQVPPEAQAPILVYGAGSSSGQYILQLLKLAGYKRILATASPQHHEYVRRLGAAEVFDYRSPTLDLDIIKAANGLLRYVADPIANRQSFSLFRKIVTSDSKIAMLRPYKDSDTLSIPKHATSSSIPQDIREQFSDVDITEVGAGEAYMSPENAEIFSKVMPVFLSQLLETRLLEPNRVRLLTEGTLKSRVIEGIDLLDNNKISGEKVVVQI